MSDKRRCRRFAVAVRRIDWTVNRDHVACEHVTAERQSDTRCMCLAMQDESVQFFKEEIEGGVAVYSVYLKKVNYHSSINDVSAVNNVSLRETCMVKIVMDYHLWDASVSSCQVWWMLLVPWRN